MNKTFLIIGREYLTRVRKRSFIVMTILGPVLMAALFIVPIYVAQMSDQKHAIIVADESGLFAGKFNNTAEINFSYTSQDINILKAGLDSSQYDVLLYIPKSEVAIPEKAVLYSSNQPSLAVKTYVESEIKKEVESMKLETNGVDEKMLRSIRTDITLHTVRIDDEGNEKKTFAEVSMVLGLFAGILIYFFIFLFGSQVMRGVIEEKSNRIVEVIISSVRPFELMMGKIVGVGLVGLTQFLLWVVLTFGIVTVFQASFRDSVELQETTNVMDASRLFQEQSPETAKQASQGVAKVFEIIDSINFPVMIFSFIFFFVFGYLLYAALFAAIGSAVDNEADTQQFMLPITIPLILSIVMAQYVVNSPEGPVAFWLSIIPFTSPVIMMLRIPFGVPYWELALSMAILVLGFLGTTWLAAKIYRTGILMYGKKSNYQELWKWITYRPESLLTPKNDTNTL